jgi:hypothetical protein
MPGVVASLVEPAVVPPAEPASGAAAPGAEAEAEPPVPGRVRPPRLAWLATLLFVLVAALVSVALPAFRAPDEAAHVDLVLYLADGNRYPDYDGRYFGEEIGLGRERYLIDLNVPWPSFDAADAPPRDERPDVDDLGGTRPDAAARRGGGPGSPYVYNQMPQHPPLYYELMAGVLRAERWLLPGDGLPSLDRELALLRLANVLLLAPLPLLAWATARRLGAGDRAATVAALVPLGLPQLAHLGGAVNNDNLFTLLGGILAVFTVGVARGRRTWRTDVAVGLVLGVALLTKAFATMFAPWAVAAYLLGAWTTRRPRDAIRGLAVAGALAVAVGGWWWIDNWLSEGQPAPTTETLTRTADQRPRGFVAEPVSFLWTFAGRLVSHTWAWIGFGIPKFELPTAIVVILTLGVVAALVAAAASAVPGLAVGAGLRRWDLALAALPLLLVAGFVLRRSWSLYETTGRYAFMQGRYLFGALVPVFALVAVGAVRLLGRRAAPVVLGVGLAIQTWVLVKVVDGSWSGPGRFGPWRGMLAWSPWPAALVVAAALAFVAVAALAARTALDGRTGVSQCEWRASGTPEREESRAS